MHTRIPNLMETPFKGIATIQLFDKEGNLIEEVQHENTYNQRIQYLNYLDTVLNCKSPDLPSAAVYYRLLNDTAPSSAYDGAPYSAFYGSPTSSPPAVRQPYATLWLSNNTKNEDLNGYPNGVPVAMATSAGVPAQAVSHLGSGLVNIAESYMSNDRLHLVFDFDTSRGNITFDSLWLNPSITRYGSTGSYLYNVLPFFHSQNIYREALTSFEFPGGYSSICARPLNNTYSMIVLSTSSASDTHVVLRNARRVLVLKDETGEVVSDCTFNSNTTLLGSFYFDEGSNTLFSIYSSASLSYMHSYDILFEGSSYGYMLGLYEINLTTGTRTLVSNMSDLLGMKKSDYNYAEVSAAATSAWKFNLEIIYLANENTTAIAAPTEGVDAITSERSPYYTWFIFDPLLKKFNLVKRLKTYSRSTSRGSFIPSFYPEYSFLADGLLYLFAAVTPDPQTDNSASVFNIKTGALIYDKLLNTGSIRGAVAYSYPYGTFYLMDSAIAYNRYIYDYNRLKTPKLYLSTLNVASAVLYKEHFCTALWTTHNKLTSPITKTDQTTMKIQYDIIWDSIKDTIIPALL